jgi:hypothetical protein
MPINPEIQNEDGTFKTGVSGNPGGKPSRANFTKLLNELFPDNLLGFMMLAKLNGISTNTTDVKNIINLIEQPEMKKKFRKYLNKMKINGKINYKSGWNKLPEKDQLSLIQWLIEFKYGKPVMQVNTEITTPEPISIKVEFIKSKK